MIFECLRMIRKERRKKGVLVLDVPLLFESKMEKLADYTVVVAASKKAILARAGRKGSSPQLAKKILSFQWPLERKVKLADFVLKNDGSLRGLEKQVSVVLKKIEERSK